jgi:hypothetical protein
MNRRVYHVVLRKESWHVRRARARRASGCHHSKAAAIMQAKALANRRGSLGQVVVHRRDGRVQAEWTYGEDPRRTRG